MSVRRLALAYALLVLVCVMAIGWRWSHGARGVAAEPEARGSAAATTSLEALSASESRSSPTEGVAPAPAGEVLAQDLPHGTRIGPSNRPVGRRPELRLRALEGLLGKPVPGARLTWASEEALREIVGTPTKNGTLPRARVEEVLERIGSVAIADSAGEVEIEVGLDMIHVHARSGDIAAHGMFLGGLDQQDLYLYPDRALEIRAVDLAGNPLAGVPVQIGIHGPWPSTLWSGATQADGRVVIERADEPLAAWHDWRRSNQFSREDTPLALRLAADVGFTTFPSAAVVFTLDPWPAGPIELRVPRSGRLAVRLVDELGAVIADEPARVRVRIAGVELGQESWRTLIGEGDFENGQVAFEPVQLGLDLELELFTRGRRNVMRFVHGPDESVPDLEVTVVPGATNPEVFGRLLDPEGAPLVDAAFELEANARSANNDVPRSSGSQILRTDAEGRFRQRLLIELPDSPICVIAFSHPARGLHPRRRVMCELTAELDEPAIDLGDVRLVAPEGL